MEWVLALSYGTLKLPRGLYIYIYIYNREILKLKN